MAIIRWQPWREFGSLRREMDNVFDNFLGKHSEREWSSGNWQPAVDFVENDDNFLVTAELPGMKKENVTLNIVNNVLTIKGEKIAERELKEDKYYRLERSSGTFQRVLSLPVDVQVDKVSAEFKDGVLKVMLPKKEEVKPKEIAIKVQ